MTADLDGRDEQEKGNDVQTFAVPLVLRSAASDPLSYGVTVCCMCIAW